ncbi:sugar phosphate isomerase/epimerase [uncultured Draconibacterium sp.]|uniref:sugar phosphate isomerase/epimerase family protein n=1 Tax=uncultured Draconibacterium sp. TaxID=1573823 RepID=UPI0029C6E0A6|nr:sugar phosphate isomerase/epimerase [uncultured Draconibacterium sp.]
MKKLVFFLIIIAFASSVVNAEKRPEPQPAPEKKELFDIAMAGYTFAKFDIDKTIETMKRTDVRNLCIKDFHLPLKSSQDEIDTFLKKLEDNEIKGYAVGPIYMKSEAEIDQAFKYAKKVGVKLIVAVPEYDLLPYVDKKVKEYGFNIAIHLHGPDINKYPDARDVWDHVKDLDPRIGMCLDIGHDTRNGNDVVEDIKKYHTRIFDVHLKDVTGNTGKGYSVEVGRGIIDIPGVVKMLRKVKYSGMISLEHERNMDNPFLGIAESIGYIRGAIAATQK